ncbi:hypothetical protein SO802_020932 [Lithocarpus litseifolius]|uniref:Uncharacterized protein n=1 Tax=Lithocarpus litseifolius TaxID=425828 RepID=A0AAW2CDG7_9ROSI
MDFWVVAVAAGAGYLAQYWQNISKRNRFSLPELSSGDSNCGKPDSPGRSFHRLARRQKLADDVSTDGKRVSNGRLSDMYQVDSASAVEVASTSGFDGEKLGCTGEYEDRNLLYVSSLPPGCSTNENVLEHEAGNKVSGDISDNYEYLPSPLGSFHGPSRNRSSLRSKCSNRQFIKPVSSLESCLMAQLYKVHAEMEDYVFSFLPSASTPTMRPLFVSDGSQILNRAYGHSFSAQIGFKENKGHNGAYLEKNENLYGIPPLEFTKKMKKTRKGRSGRLSSSIKLVNGKRIHSQDGSPDSMILFCLGISIGIIASILTNKREVDNLKEVLKQTENLVQDLQEELEMKDSMTVKELANDNYESQDTCDNSCDRALNAFSPEMHLDGSTKYDDKKSYDQKAEESSETMSKIEAELEAELERLGLNISACSLDRRLSDIVELDPDFVADFTQGELREDMIHGQAAAQPKSYQDAGDTSTPHSGTYAVSPRELSLRLHEVIQSRLEERVQELETALQYSQRKLKLVESGHKNSWKEFSSNERRYSSTQEFSIANECYPMAQPLVMNLSEEALDAYNEAYIELMKIDDSEEQDLSLVAHENKHQEGFNPSDQHAFTDQNGGIGGSIPHLAIDDDTLSMEFFSSKTKAFGEHTSEVKEFKDVCVSEDENSDCDDEIEKQLIKQIVEKTKKGSPVVLNAQRVLFSMDESEH